jgi:hypothetical protein
MAFQYQPRRPASASPPATASRLGLVAEFRDACKGRAWWIPLPVWLYLGYVGWFQYRDPVDFQPLFTGIDLAIHEGGHLLLRPFGDAILHAAGGTLAQLAAPVAAMAILWRQRDSFGVTFCLGWLSVNLIEVGVYMADARARELPLVTAEGGGSDAPTQHDWEFLFTQFGLMDWDTTIGFWTRAVGSAVMVLALVLGAWVMIESWRRNSSHSSSMSNV